MTVEPEQPRTPPRRSIAFVTRNSTFGGGERNTIQILNRLDRSRFGPITVLALGQDPWSAPLAASSPDIKVIPGVASTPELWWKLRRLSPDIVVVSGFQTLFHWWEFLAARLSGAKYLASVERVICLPVPVPGSPSRLRNWVRDHFGYVRRQAVSMQIRSRLCDRVICVSDAVRRSLLENFGFTEQQLLVVHNGIEVKDHEQPDDRDVRGELGLATGEPLLVSAARLTREKGFDLLALAVQELKREKRRFKCVIIGDGVERDHLERLIEKLGIADTLLLVGFRKDIRPYLHAADVFVLPTLYEAFGQVLLEAMASGLPCVANDVGGVGEVVRNEQSGLLVKPESADLARGLRRMLDNPCLARKMGACGREIASSVFDIAKTMEQFQTALLGTRRSSGGDNARH